MTGWTGAVVAALVVAAFLGKVIGSFILGIAGVLVSNKPLAAEAPSIMDIAPTVLKYFNIAVPSSLDGKSIF